MDSVMRSLNEYASAEFLDISKTNAEIRRENDCMERILKANGKTTSEDAIINSVDFLNLITVHNLKLQKIIEEKKREASKIQATFAKLPEPPELIENLRTRYNDLTNNNELLVQKQVQEHFEVKRKEKEKEFDRLSSECDQIQKKIDEELKNAHLVEGGKVEESNLDDRDNEVAMPFQLVELSSDDDTEEVTNDENHIWRVELERLIGDIRDNESSLSFLISERDDLLLDLEQLEDNASESKIETVAGSSKSVLSTEIVSLSDSE